MEATGATLPKANEQDVPFKASDDGTSFKIKRAITFNIENEGDLPQEIGPIKSGVRRASTAGDLSKSPASSAPGPGLLRRITSGHPLSKIASRASSVEHAMPYLSYASTVGRNSTFVNLTHEQREELGGIESRALKTLVIILVGKSPMTEDSRFC